MDKGRKELRDRRLSDQDLEGTLDRTRGRLQHWTDEVIAEAARQGHFDDLPGKGKPLAVGPADPYGGAEAEVYKVLKNAGFTPEWVELRKKISADIEWLRRNPDHPERSARLVAVNEAIKKHNGLIPKASLAYAKVPPDFGLG